MTQNFRGNLQILKSHLRRIFKNKFFIIHLKIIFFAQLIIVFQLQNLQKIKADNQ
jgi:hypothetical protein